MQRIIIDFGRVELLGFELSLRVFGYGLMLVFGFLAALYLAQRRALRAGESPHNVAHCGLLALVAGVVGARAAYVIENYEHFAGRPHALGAMLNITSGGLIYYGGVVLAALAVLVFLRVRRLPIRRYLDIIAPSLMIGLAFGRAGCTLNGCCYGAPCRHDWPLAMRFPLYSKPLLKFDGRDNPFSNSTDTPTPVFADQLSPPPGQRLVNPRRAAEAGDGDAVTLIPVWDRHGALDDDQLVTLRAARDVAEEAFDALAGDDGQVGRDDWLTARNRGGGFLRGSEHWSVAVLSDGNGDGTLTFDEAWDYLQWRRAWLIERFGPLHDPAAAGRANAALQADELQVPHIPLDGRLINWPDKAKWDRHFAKQARAHARKAARAVTQKELYPLLPPRELHAALASDQLAVLLDDEQTAHDLFDRAAGPDRLMDRADWDRALAAGDGVLRGSEHWSEALALTDNDNLLTFSDVWRYLQWRGEFLGRAFGPLDDPAAAKRANAYLQADEQALAAAQRSLPVKPAQPLGILNALVLAALLMGFHRLRRREGQVFAMLLILYPITRFLLEMVRSNGHDLTHGVLTHNQYTSMILVAAGVALWVFLGRLPPAPVGRTQHSTARRSGSKPGKA
ncbi:MAG: prolipoprotein diacylglyceryl transferase [Phycisphaerae bacterium]|nr:prolipoprotein diacylglyceryl transferase [Phycisphaerae bacterium]